LGTVRLMEALPRADAPAQAEWEHCRAAVIHFLEQQVRPVIEPALGEFSSGAVQLVGTGGTTSLLARIQLELATFDRDRIAAMRLTRQEVRQQRERLWSLPLATWKDVHGLPADCADVIWTVVAIYE